MSAVFFDDDREPLSVGKILCVGRNYSEHAKELGHSVPSSPVVFLKPSTAIIHAGEQVALPPVSKEVHHEVEMVIVIGKRGKNIGIKDAYDFVEGFAVGLDMTLRDVQNEAKRKGEPWSVAKGFDTSAPISTAVPKEKVGDPHSLSLSLKVNGKLRQQSNTSKMIFAIEFLVSYLSKIFTLEPGDLIFTGTPEGVGPVHAGDVLEAELEGVGTLRVGVTHAPT